MLKRFSSLILALVIGGSVLAGTVRPSDEHVCKMAGMEMMTDMQMPPASPSLSHSHKMMAGGEMMPGMEMMPGIHMPPASPSLSHSHEMMPGMEMMPGLETMPCCLNQRAQSVSSQSGSQGQCCINIPQETGSSGTKFSLRPPAFSIAVNHPATVPPPITVPKPYEWSYSTEVFLPNLHSSYLRNLSFLI
jgi:hypothetical protein